MSNLKVCRICLCKNAKVYKYDRYHLKQYYEEIMCKKVYENDGLPNYFCFECAAILYKFHKFKEKCVTGEMALIELFWCSSITLSSISQLDRKSKNLQSTIDIISVSKRVKTYIVKNKTLSENLVKEVEECKLEYDSDNSLDDKNLAEIKNKMINEKADCISEDDETNIDVQINPEEKVASDLEDDTEYDSDNSLDDKNLAEIKNEMINEEADCIKEDDKTNIDVQINPEEKVGSDLEDDRMLSDCEESYSESLHGVELLTIKEEFCNGTAIKKQNIINTEKGNSDNETLLNKNPKKQKRKKKKKAKIDLAEVKTRKFEVFSTKNNLLDPAHWLKINLTEEEALEEFRARAQDRKYVSAKYQCTACFKGFSQEDMLNRHNKLRHSESLGPVECRFCKMRFKWKCYLTRHISQHYTKYKCLRCDLMCPLKNTALFHNDYHNGVVRKCMHCGEEFRHLSSYYTHLRTHRSEYVCTLCGESFVSTMGLNMHRRAMHINTVVNPEEEVNIYCERCDMKFVTRKAYEEHVFHSAKHAEGVEDLAHEVPAPSMPKRRKKVCYRRNPRRLTPCTVCNRNFPSLTAYLKHHTAEHKDDPLPSKEGERHICEICGASLAASSVASHLNTHTREKIYTCSTCRMQFNSKSSMNRHQLTHTGEKPYECSMCEKRFTQKSSMKLHYRTFHLKEPYPKRNRRKNAGIQQEIEDYRINEEDLEKNQKVDRWR